MLFKQVERVEINLRCRVANYFSTKYGILDMNVLLIFKIRNIILILMISSTYNVGWTYFESWIESIAYVRNICAHYGRIYNAKLAKRPTLYKQYSRLNIDNSHIFSTLICLSHLMPQDVHWLSFVDQIELLIENYPYVKIELMGFPDNWKSILLNE